MDFNWPPKEGGGSGGTVTEVSVETANGFAGSVADPTTTPAITLSTTVTGVLKGDGTAISAQTVGNLTESTSSVLTITGGTGAVLGSGASIQVKLASGSQSGYLVREANSPRTRTRWLRNVWLGSRGSRGCRGYRV